MLHVVFFLLADSLMSEFYVPTFQNNLCVPSYTIYEDGSDSVPKRQHIKSDAGESPKRNNVTFRTWRKFKIKSMLPTVKCTLNP